MLNKRLIRVYKAAFPVLILSIVNATMFILQPMELFLLFIVDSF
jgi:hypothetical protein